MNKWLCIPGVLLISSCSLDTTLSDDGNDSTGISDPGTEINEPDPASGRWYKPAPEVSWQWQLEGSLNTTYNAEIYDVDLVETSSSEIASLQAQGRKVICYFSAGSRDKEREDADLFPDAVVGRVMDGWPDENWLDIRSEDIRPVMAARLQAAADKGCDGVEPDNVDGFQNDTGFSLTAADQIQYNRWLANTAHGLGLSVGLKNALDIVPELVDYFDFAVNEQCFAEDECEALEPVISAGKAVLNAEYRDDGWSSPDLTRICSEAADMQLSTLVLDLELDDSYRLACWE